jgi:hypothetical protein
MIDYYTHWEFLAMDGIHTRVGWKALELENWLYY